MKESFTTNLISNTLRGGLILSFIVIMFGGILYLYSNGHEIPDYSTFKGEPQDFKTIQGIFSLAFQGHSLGIILLGILILIATPVIRVVLCICAFAIQKDFLYIIIGSFVFLTLLYSLFLQTR